MYEEMVARGYRMHEFGDSVLIEAMNSLARHRV
jgi:S-adenosylmethionine:tRNA-ribosyltransferase-isomerase (queuine synthetase)